MRNYSKQWCSESNPHAKDKIMFKLFNNIFGKKEVTVDLAANVQLTVTPVVGGVNAVLIENGDIFVRRETAFFGNLHELVSSLGLSDDVIVRKLSKAF